MAGNFFQYPGKDRTVKQMHHIMHNSGEPAKLAVEFVALRQTMTAQQSP